MSEDQNQAGEDLNPIITKSTPKSLVLGSSELANKFIVEGTGGANSQNVDSPSDSIKNSKQRLNQIHESVMTFNKKFHESTNSQRSIGNNMQSVFSSEDYDDFTHNICEMNHVVHIKNSFDEWKTKVGAPFNQNTRNLEQTTKFETNMTSKAHQEPLIVEEDQATETPLKINRRWLSQVRDSNQALSEDLRGFDNQLSIDVLMQPERSNSKIYTNSTGSLNQNAGSGSATQFINLKKGTGKSKFYKEDNQKLGEKNDQDSIIGKSKHDSVATFGNLAAQVKSEATQHKKFIRTNI